MTNQQHVTSKADSLVEATKDAYFASRDRLDVAITERITELVRSDLPTATRLTVEWGDTDDGHGFTATVTEVLDAQANNLTEEAEDEFHMFDSQFEVEHDLEWLAGLDHEYATDEDFVLRAFKDPEQPEPPTRLLDRHLVPDKIHGLPVVAVVPLPHRVSELPIAVVICHDESQRTAGVPWVTWFWCHQSSGGYATEGGYHGNYADALLDLADRSKRYGATSTGTRF